MAGKEILLIMTTVASIAGIATAQESESEIMDFGRHASPTNGFFGLRSWLDEQGIIIEMVYTGEVFSNLRGGLNTSGASEYRGNFDMTLTADAEKFGLAPGSIFIYTQLGYGKGITEKHVGDAQTLSNLCTSSAKMGQICL